MPTSWITTTIGEQVTLQRGIDITKASQRNGVVPVVSSGGISSFHDTAYVPGPGVILGRKGVVGSVYYVSDDYWPHDTTLWVRDFHGNDPRFVYYFFQNMVPVLASMDVGSANPTLNRNHVHPLRVLWPPIDEQRAIAHILGMLDDKIELNRKMNETLDALARTIFRSWFVDFDPVRAKAEGRVPEGMEWSAETAALFPDRLVGSALGSIPDGWSATSLGEATSMIRRGIAPKYADVGTVVINQKCIRNGEIDKSKARYHDAKQRSIEGRLLEMGDVLINSTGVGTLGRVAQVQELDESTVADSHVTVVRASHDMSHHFLGLSLMTRESLIEQMGEGSTGQTELSRVKIAQLPLVVPPSDVLGRFDQIVSPFRALVAGNRRESIVLAELRDTLLPELLSGRMSI